MFRMLPREFRAKASAEGPSGNRALLESVFDRVPLSLSAIEWLVGRSPSRKVKDV